jgi:hypothetical protein
MSSVNIALVVLAALSVSGALLAAVVLAMRQQALNKYTTVRKALDEFTEKFQPGDLVFGPHRFHLGRAQMMLQTAESRYAQAVKYLCEELRFWKALNEFWIAEGHLESARREVRAASGGI